MLPEKSAPPAGQGTAAASDRLDRGGGLRLLDDGTVVLADVTAGRLLRLTGGGPGKPLEVLARVPGQLVAAAPLAGRAGEWLLAAGGGFAVLDGGPEPVPLGSGPAGGLSSAVCDPSGRMWAATRDGSVLRLGPDGTTTEVLEDLRGPGGLAVSPDGDTLYISCGTGELHAVRVDPATGRTGTPRLLARVPERDGRPAGMVTDGFGRLWCALWDGAAVRCFGPDGRVMLSVPLPAWRPSDVCLTGGQLLVTTELAGIVKPGALDGAVLQLACTVPVAPAGAAVLTR